MIDETPREKVDRLRRIARFIRHALHREYGAHETWGNIPLAFAADANVLDAEAASIAATIPPEGPCPHEVYRQVGGQVTCKDCGATWRKW